MGSGYSFPTRRQKVRVEPSPRYRAAVAALMSAGQAFSSLGAGSAFTLTLHRCKSASLNGVARLPMNWNGRVKERASQVIGFNSFARV